MTNLINALKNKGISYEVMGNQIGIRTGKHVWFWFNDHGGYLMFDHSYSQNTGRIKSGVMTGIRAKMAIKKRTGVEL